MWTKFIYLILFFAFIQGKVFSQSKNTKIDSLQNELAKNPIDTQKVRIYVKLAEEYLYAMNPLCIQYAENVKKWAEKNESPKYLAKYHNIIGRWYRNKGITKDAIREFEEDLKISKEIGDSIGTAAAYNNLGAMHTDQGMYNTALTYHLNALKIREKIKDEVGMAFSYHNIGMIYDHQKKYNDALENYFKSIEIKEKKGLNAGAANSLLNIGLIFIEKQLYDSSLLFLDRAFLKYAFLDDSISMHIAYVNMAWAYNGKKEYEKATKTFRDALSYGLRNKTQFIEAYCYQGLGDTYKAQQKHSEAIAHYSKSQVLFKEMNANKELTAVYKNMSECFHEIGEPQNAYDYLLKYHHLNDTLLLQNNEKIVAEMQEKYESTQKEQSIALLTQQGKIKDLQRNVFIAIGVMLIFVAAFMYKSIRDKMKANKALQEKNTIISDQKDAIEKQKNSIVDSIKYAKRIQESFLVPKEYIYSKFEDAFVLYKPRDIVSGDFYWFAEKNDKLLLAAVDCTGHGVPGALMSMLGNRLLNEIVNIQGETIPGNILERLHLGVINDLQQSQDSQSQDGMDMFICAIDKKKNILEYAGAVNPAILIENNELIPLKSTFLSIGGVRLNETDFNRKYETFTRPLVKDSIIYMFSDGYIDQFNNELKKKFGSANLKKFIEANHRYPLQEQMIKFDETIENWKADYRQMDDILMMGIKIG